MALSLIFSSCAGITKRLEAPTIQIVDIKVKEMKALEASFSVQLRVLNPNELSIITKGINCDIELNNVHLATGVSGTTVEIPAFGSAIVPIEIYSSAFDIVKTIMNLSEKEDVKYRIKGRLQLEGSGFILSRIPFESEGSLNIKEFMKQQ